jgi:transcriptional regulator NrdR family protein
MFVTAKIKKRNGSLENYDRTKLLLSMVRAQATPEQAEQALTQIEAWLTQQKVEFIATGDIHSKVTEVLKGISPQAATDYEIYRKSHAKQASTG